MQWILTNLKYNTKKWHRILISLASILLALVHPTKQFCALGGSSNKLNLEFGATIKIQWLELSSPSSPHPKELYKFGERSWKQWIFWSCDCSWSWLCGFQSKKNVSWLQKFPSDVEMIIFGSRFGQNLTGTALQQFLRLPWSCDWQMKRLISQQKAIKMKGFARGHELDLRTWPTGSPPTTTPQRSPCPRCQRHYEDGPSHRHSKETFQGGGRRNLIHSAWINWNSWIFWISPALCDL